MLGLPESNAYPPSVILQDEEQRDACCKLELEDGKKATFDYRKARNSGI
jgi:hypothetical protein